MNQTVRVTMAQALLRFLAAQYLEVDGEERRFVHGVMGIFGHGNVTGLGEALEADDCALPFIQGHNEQGMVHAAVAFAKQSNRTGIYACTSSIGPGALNMVTAAAVATVNRLPVLLLPGDIFACRQPDPVLQQVEDPADYTVSANDAFRPVSRFFDRIMRPEQLMTACIQAMRTLTDPAACGAVTLALPQDVQAEAYDYPVSFFAKRVHVLDRRPPSPVSLERAAAALANAKRPLLVAGGGVHYSYAKSALREFAETFHVPVVETQAGKGALPWDHPLNAGGVGVTGSLAGNRLAKDADLVIAVGTRLTDFTTASKTAFAPEVRTVAINVCAMDAVKQDALPVLADARETLIGLRQTLLATGYRSAYADGDIEAQKSAWDTEVDRLYGLEQSGGLTQTAVLGLVNRTIEENAVIVAAAGSLPGDLHRLWRVPAAGSYHMEYGFSCMGYEIAGALGAKLAEPGRPVYALVGDGSYLMLHSELLTCLQEQQKITVVVFDNSGYQCIHNLQRGHGSRGFGNEFRRRAAATQRLTGDYLPIDFCAYASALGATGYRAATLAELGEALVAARADAGPVVIDVKVLPGTCTDGYESWWRVGVAEVSTNPAVTAAHQANHVHVQAASPY